MIISSLNRYERKKNIPLALEAFNYLLKAQLPQSVNKKKLYLVIAGGYDTRLSENVELHAELMKRAIELGI